MASSTTMLRRRLCALLTSVLCLGTGAQGAPVAGNVVLSYRQPPGCPGEATFRERTADLYDFHDPFVPPGPGATSRMRILIEHIGTAYRAKVSVLDEGGNAQGSTVELHEHCDALVYLVAHRVRLMMRPAPAAPAADTAPDSRDQEKVRRRLDRLEEAAEAQDEKNKAQDLRMKAQDETIARLKKDLEGEKKRKMDLTFALSMGALMTANLTSNVGPGVWLSGDLRSGPLMLGLDLRAVLPSQVVVGPFDLDLSQIVGLLTPCGRYSVLFGCAVAGAGLQIGHDSNIANLAPGQSRTQFSGLVQLGGRLGVEVPLGESRFAVRGWGEVLYTTPHWEFHYNDSEFVTERPDVSAFFGLGFVVKLGEEPKGAK